MKRSFSELCCTAIDTMMSNKGLGQGPQPLPSKPVLALYMIVMAAVGYGVYVVSHAPDVNTFLAILMSLSFIKFFILYVVATWVVCFAWTFFAVLIDNALLYKLNGKISIALSIGLLFFMIYGLNINFVHEHIENTTLAMLEEELGDVSPQSFAHEDGGNFSGTVSLKNGSTSEIIPYTITVTGYKSGRRSSSYHVDIKYTKP